jgi:hypothetical protein
MAVRLLRAVNGQAANTTYWGTDERDLVALGYADYLIERASDYQDATRVVTTATAVTVQGASVYLMNSGSPQTLSVDTSGYWARGHVLTVVQLGAGAVTIAGRPGVTITTAQSSLVMKGAQNIAQLLKIGPDTWVAFGGLGE